MSKPYDGGQYLRPGDNYRISVVKLAIFLAHSSHRIRKDPTTDPRFDGQERRFLWRVGNHPIRNEFELELCDEIMKRCASSSLRWDSVGLYRQGCRAETELDNPPTVLISVSEEVTEGTIFSAEKLAQEVEALLRQRKFFDVHVEIVTYPYAMNGVGEARSALETTDDYSFAMSKPTFVHPAFNGASIGPEGQDGSGTLSCYLSLRRGEKHRVCALTCHHVASLGQQDLMAALSRANSVRILSPSEMDGKAILDKLRHDITELQTNIASREKEKQEREWIGKIWPNVLEERLRQSKQDLEVLKTALTSFQSSWENHRLLGDTWLSSGLADPQPGQNLKDWALVNVEPSRFYELAHIMGPDMLGLGRACREAKNICNSLHIECPIYDDYQFLRFFTPGHEEIVPVQEIQNMATARESTYLFLHGRSTTFSVGILHDVRDGVCTRYLPRNGTMREFTSRELVVLDVQSDHSRYNSPIGTVSEKGDSGAALRLADGRILGFVFGSNKSDQSGRPATYVSMADTLLGHIKQITGADQVEIQGIRRDSNQNSPHWVD